MANRITSQRTSAGSRNLHELISQLVASFTPAAIRHQSFMINEVPADLEIKKQPDILIGIIGSIIQSVSLLADQACIRITASSFDDCVLLQVQGNNSLDKPAMTTSMNQLRPLSSKIGANIRIVHPDTSATSIALGFSI
ncbi:MAG: hypothetical protein JSU05_10915 [Bacteroidetes bacterium]|nr:hypothetical protein [Bacteroidota bacterium]